MVFVVQFELLEGGMKTAWLKVDSGEECGKLAYTTVAESESSTCCSSGAQDRPQETRDYRHSCFINTRTN